MVKNSYSKININVFNKMGQVTGNKDQIFIEINLLMETFIVNVDELLLNFPVFNYSEKYQLLNTIFYRSGGSTARFFKYDFD